MNLSRTQVREVDRRAIEDFGVPGMVLMENAGRGCAELLISLGIHAPVLICCGKGNNGGDGFVIARHLDNHGVQVKVLLFANPDQLSGDALANYQILEKSAFPISSFPAGGNAEKILATEFDSCEWIVDALLGTGLSGQVKSPLAEVIQSINASGLRVFSVDIPSGLDCDTGLPLGCAVKANHTATFVAMKKGFAEPACRQWTGQIHVLPIGAPREYQLMSQG